MTRKYLFKRLFPEANSSFMDCLGNECNEVNGCDKCKTLAQELHLIQEGWSKFPSHHNNIEWSMLKGIIDDALVNGFEVTILNGTIYYREKQ